MKEEKRVINLKGLQFHHLNSRQYKIGQLIGEGGYGCIFYAQDKNGQQRAIKIVDMNLTNQQMKRCLEKQDKAMKMIHAQHVIQCYDSQIDISRNIKYIVMDLCNSLSLWHLIVYKGHLLEIQAKIYLKNILAGLISMFRFGYSHRDIKSSNICLKNGSCVIIDLGCTKQFTNQVGQGFIKSKTMVSRVGSIMTKSPEMLRKQKYTYRTDLWAVGILYYQMLCGVTPFYLTGEQNDQQALDHITNNISKIYQEGYIQKRIKQQYSQLSSSFQYRANKKISPEAKQFLSTLIFLEPEKRASSQAIKKSTYLRQKLQISQKNIWQAAQCLLPLKDIDWQQFVKQMEKSQKLENTEYQKQEYNKQQLQISVHYENIVTPMLLAQKREINQKYQQKVQQDKIQLNRTRYFDFQIKRIKLLMKLRKYLKKIQLSNPKLMCYQAILKISQYCNIKFGDITGAARQNNIGLYSSSTKNTIINHDFLLKYLSQIYIQDQKECQKSKGWKKKKIQSIDEQKNYDQLYIRIKNEGVKIGKDWICFFQNHKQILNFTYQPSMDYPQWIPWSSFIFIVEVAKNS